LRQAQATQRAAEARAEQLDQWLAALRIHVREDLAMRLAEAEEDMIAIVHAAICRLLGQKAIEPASVSAAVREAIEQCCGVGAEGSPADLMAVRVHPDDLNALQSDSPLMEWLVQTGARGVRWLPDPRVELGGCIVQGAQGGLDARLETQLGTLREVLLSGRIARDEGAFDRRVGQASDPPMAPSGSSSTSGANA
jgi:flagellar assembly protein FliH